MKKATQMNRPKAGTSLKMLPAVMSTLVLALLCCIPTRASAQVACINCPANGQAAGVAAGIFVTRTNGSIVLPGNPVGACEQIVVHTDLGYKAAFPGGVVGAGYFGGTANVIAFSGGSVVPESTANVTPAVLATTKIGPVAPAPNACGDTDDLALNNLTYSFTAADIAAGSVRFRLDYTGGTTLIVPCNLQASGSVEFTIQIAPLPTCTVTPANQVCPGSSASFTVNPTGSNPFTFSWTGPAGFTSTNQTITINNAQAANGGYYVATARDVFGCATVCSNLLTVYTNPIVSVAPTNVCVGSAACLIASSTTFGSTVASYSWTKQGSATVVSTTDRVCFANPQLADGGTYQVILTDTHGCSATNTGVLTVRPNPTCNLTGPSDVCELTTNTYSSTVNPPTGTVTHSWAFVGSHPNASFVGSTTGPTVQVAAGSAITTRDCFNLTDTVTVDGCPGACTNTFCIIPCHPALKVYKQVVCYTNVCEPFSANLTTQKTALGVRTDNPLNCPAFCYRITVTNAGNVPLTSLAISDSSVPGPNLNLSGCPFPTTLPVGGWTNCIIPAFTRCSNDVNVVTATAVGQNGSGTTANLVSQDTNTVTVVPISIACGIYVRTNGGSAFVKYDSCPSQPLGVTYTVRIGVTNTGQYALQNVTAAGLSGFGGCFTSPTNLGSLAIGAVALIDCNSSCTSVSSNFYSVSVQGEASQAAGHVCAYNAQGQPITTQSQCETCVLCVGQPAIKIWKQVVCYSNICEPFSANLDLQKSATGVRIDPANDANCPAFCYRITVTNLGNVTLSNLVIVDANNSDGKVLNLSGCGFPTTLAPAGQPNSSATCTVTTNHCVNSTNIVTATAVGQTSSGATTPVSSTDTNRVTVNPISVACTILISTNSGASFVPPSTSGCSEFIIGTTYSVRIVVTNTGSYALQNVVLTSTGTSPLCFAATNVGGLAIGESKVVNCTGIACSAVSTNNYAVSVTAEASQSAGHVCDYNIAGQHIVATSSCNACVICSGTPCIKVFKGIACVICTTNANGVVLGCASATGGFEKEAFGVRSDTQDPAFCYQIVVTNCGSLSLNVTLTDAKLGMNNIPIGILAPNQSFTTNLVKDWHVTTTNVVIANGTVAGTGGSVSDTNFAIAHVRPASIACVKTVSVNGGPFQHSIQLTNEIITSIAWAVTLTNTGQADLENVTITDLSQNDDLPCNINMVVTNIFPVGGSLGPIIVCSNNTGFTSCTNLSIDNDIRIVANAAAEGTNCVWDINGTNIMVQTSCDAHLDVFCVVPNACRVTGGGRQDDPTICPSDVRYVTHGGQVGAPVGNKVCSIDTNIPNFFLGNPCIHGRWTHVRHVKGGLEGNFHARFFDTLDCACLDTAFDPTTCQYGPLSVAHGICGDRSTGPLPRPAGANKIAFTGVGDWACPNGRREGRACLFRVDIEDRGEPGNAHALASNGKANRVPDRYRIRIWVLSDTELAQLNGAGPDRYLLNFRNAISACNGLTYRDGGVIGQCGDANTCSSADSCTRGGSGLIMFPDGAPIRLPNIDDGGEMLHGNHQIHPAIKNCDPFNPTGPGLAKP